jgi:hypothetical protein
MSKPKKKKSQSPVYLVVSYVDYEGPDTVTLFRSKAAALKVVGPDEQVIGPLKPRARTSLHYG